MLCERSKKNDRELIYSIAIFRICQLMTSSHIIFPNIRIDKQLSSDISLSGNQLSAMSVTSLKAKVSVADKRRKRNVISSESFPQELNILYNIACNFHVRYKSYNIKTSCLPETIIDKSNIMSILPTSPNKTWCSKTQS